MEERHILINNLLLAADTGHVVNLLNMTALLAVEFEPHANTFAAMSSLRRPGLVITSIDVGANEAVASVEVLGLDILDAALAAVCSCACVRSGTVFPTEA